MRRPLRWELTPAEALRLVRGDPHPVALFGAWAGGCNIVGPRPRVRSARAGRWRTSSTERCPAPPDPGAARPSAAGGSATWDTAPRRGAAAGRPAAAARVVVRLLRPRAAPGPGDRASGSSRRCGPRPRRRPRAPVRGPVAARAARAAAGPPATIRFCGGFRLVPSAAEHRAAVRAAVEYIRQGDIFQANICLRAEAGFSGDPLDAFCRAATALDPPVRGVPAPCRAARWRACHPSCSCAAPGSGVESRPIKGTAPPRRRPRPGRRAARRAGALGQEPRGERDDRRPGAQRPQPGLRPGQRAPSPACSAPSRIPASGTWSRRSAARSAPASTDGDLIRAAFPPGSVTGAPKVRALEVIDELEAAPREVYTGAIGYRSPVAGLELNVAIRTFEFAAGRVWLGAGGGIVADSDPAAEYTECLHKAGPLISRASAPASRHRRPPPGPADAAAPGSRPRPRPACSARCSSPTARPRASTLTSPGWPPAPAELYGKDLPAGAATPTCAACLARAPDRPAPDHRPPGRRPAAGHRRGRPAPAAARRRRVTLRPADRPRRHRRAQVARPAAARRARPPGAGAGRRTSSC